jgi:hypothetical protein
MIQMIQIHIGDLVGLEWGPEVAQALNVRVAVLGDNRGDHVRAPQGHAQPGRGAVVEDVDCELCDLKGVDEGEGCGGEAGEAVAIPSVATMLHFSALAFL